MTERAASFGLDQAVEGDQDIGLDFGDDGGGFSISTDEGDFSLNFDEDNGGVVFNTNEGDGVISFDEENGSINFDTNGGDGAISFDDDGGVTIETEDGNLGIFNSVDAPPTWPQTLGVPATLVPGSQSFSVLDLGEVVVTTGVFNHDNGEPYGENVVATLLSSGWTQNITSNQGGVFFAQLTNGDRIAQIVSDDRGYSTVSITQPK